jgi:hypothetical protein
LPCNGLTENKEFKLNAKQKQLACIIAGAILFMILFPPYAMDIISIPGAGYHADFGYAFIGMLPRKSNVVAQVSIPALAVQIMCFAILGGMLWLELRNHS